MASPSLCSTSEAVPIVDDSATTGCGCTSEIMMAVVPAVEYLVYLTCAVMLEFDKSYVAPEIVL